LPWPSPPSSSPATTRKAARKGRDAGGGVELSFEFEVVQGELAYRLGVDLDQPAKILGRESPCRLVGFILLRHMVIFVDVVVLQEIGIDGPGGPLVDGLLARLGRDGLPGEERDARWRVRADAASAMPRKLLRDIDANRLTVSPRAGSDPGAS
jgi:hypothetical protein